MTQHTLGVVRNNLATNLNYCQKIKTLFIDFQLKIHCKFLFILIYLREKAKLFAKSRYAPQLKIFLYTPVYRLFFFFCFQKPIYELVAIFVFLAKYIHTHTEKLDFNNNHSSYTLTIMNQAQNGV